MTPSVHLDETPLASSTDPTTTATINGKRDYSDGKGRYRLRGFVTHMGQSTSSGHYVAHMEKEGVWYIFNDEKVAVSKRTPRGYGYLYLYERLD